MTATVLPLPQDFGAKTFEMVTVPLFLLARHTFQSGLGLAIGNRTFKDCIIQGPAVLMSVGGVTFERCDLGNARGDMRNLILKPMGDSIVGAVAMGDCSFVGCTFEGIGYTGHPGFIDVLLNIGKDRP